MTTSIVTATQAHRVASNLDAEIAKDFCERLDRIEKEPLGNVVKTFILSCYEQIKIEANKGHYEASLYVPQDFFGTAREGEALQRVINLLTVYDYEVWVDEDAAHSYLLLLVVYSLSLFDNHNRLPFHH